MVMELGQGRTRSNEKSGRETGGGTREEVGEERNRGAVLGGLLEWVR